MRAISLTLRVTVINDLEHSKLKDKIIVPDHCNLKVASIQILKSIIANQNLIMTYVVATII